MFEVINYFRRIFFLQNIPFQIKYKKIEAEMFLMSNITLYQYAK